MFVVRNTVVFAIFNTISCETPLWKCFEKLLLANPMKEEENAKGRQQQSLPENTFCKIYTTFNQYQKAFCN